MFLSACDRFAAPRAPSQTAHRRVLRPARHTRVCLRGRVLRRWPRLRAVARRASPNRSRMSPLVVFVAAFGFSVSLPFAAPSLPAPARSGGRGASSRNTASRSASRRLRAIAEPSRRVSFTSTLVASLRSSAGFLSAPCLCPLSQRLTAAPPHPFTSSPRCPRQQRNKAGNPPAADGDTRPSGRPPLRRGARRGTHKRSGVGPTSPSRLAGAEHSPRAMSAGPTRASLGVTRRTPRSPPEAAR